MADEYTCWVAVVGLPSANSKEQIGPGKSCLCNRFMRSKEDEYSDFHPSGVSNQDFCSPIINNENFLYWGYAKRTFDNINWGIRIIEQTQFYDDTNFKLFGGNESYLKRALNPKITTHGTKYQYISYDHLACNDKDSRSEKFPCEKHEKVVIDAFIYVFDVSREDHVHFVEQYNMAESFIKGAKKPLVFVFSKVDEKDCKHIEAIKNLTLRNKVPVIEVSSHNNINIDHAFHLAAKLAKHGSKHALKNHISPSYEESFKILKERRAEVSRLFNTLTEKSVVDKNVTWFEFMQFCKENKHFQNYCELYGTKKAKSILDRHIRNLTIKLNEKRKNLYLKDLETVFAHFIVSLDLSNHSDAVQYIRNHPDFNEYFVALSDEKSWKDTGVQHGIQSNRILIPLDLLNEQEAVICFEHRIAKLQEEQDQIDLADEFERSLTQADNILPGLSLDDVLNCVDDKFSKLRRERSESIYNDHQLVIAKQYEKDFEEMLLENTELFRMQLPGGDLKPDAISSLTHGLKEDVRWTNFTHMENKRDCLLLQHLAAIVKGTRNQLELSSVEKRYKSVIVEKTMARKELSYSNTLNVGEEEVAVIVMSGVKETAEKWATKISQECAEVTVDDVNYNVAVTARDPDNIEIFPDFPIHLIIGIYRTDEWETFRAVTRSFDRVQKSYRGLPCQIVYIPSDKIQTVTDEEGSRFAHRLNCELISEDTLQDNMTSVISNNIALIQTRSEFIETPSTANKTVLNLTIRMLYDDDISLKELTNSLFKFQYSFVHPYEPGVFVIHTLLNEVPVFVMVHLLHYLDKESYTEHGCILVCKDSRRASLENARYYMTENNVTRSLGLVVVQTPKSLSYTTAITQTATDLGIKYTMLEQEQANRRVSIGQHATAVDVLLLQVLQNSVQFIGDSNLDLSLEAESSEDEGSFNDLPVKGGTLHRHRSNTLDRLGFASPPPHGPYGSLPEKFKSLSVSWNELRDEGFGNHPWSSMPRNMREKVSLDKTPPIYSIVNKKRGSTSSFENFSTPKSPPIPPRPERNFSETSSEGQEDNHNKSGGMVTSSQTDSPFKNKRIPIAFNKKKLTDEELEQKRLNKRKKREESKIKKREDKEERKRQKQLEKNKKMLASWDPKRDISLSSIKSLKHPTSIPDFQKPAESCYFGRSLEEIAPWGGVPYYASLCIEYLECHDLTIEGLYRKEGNKLQINQLEAAFEMAFSDGGAGESLSKFNIVELDVSVHVVASSTKKFLKRLPCPLVPHEFHDLLLAAVEVGGLEATANADHVTRSLVKVQEILNTFDRQIKLTLAYVIRHLSRIAELKDQNKMSAYNLAIIFWPTLLQPTQEVLMRNEDRTKFSNMVEFLIDNSDSLFGPELPSCPPPDDEDIYDIVFHPELVKQKTQEEYEYIKRPKTYFNQALRVGHVPSLIKQIVTFIEHGRITTSLYVHTARSDLVDNFVKMYEAAYASDEHRSLNLRKVLKNLTITRSPTDDSISASTTTDENSVSSTSGDLSMTDSRLGASDEQSMDCTILATVLKRYLASLIIPVIPAEHHVNFLDIASVSEESRVGKIRDCFEELKQSHKILLSYLMKHLSLMRDKGVVQLEETFAPILFYGNTELCSSDILDLTEPTSPVPITYSPNMVQQQRTIRFLLENVHVFALKDGVSLYAPLYETMEQDKDSPCTHQYSSVHYTLPVLPEETRHYDLPTDLPHYIDPLYTSVSNPYTRDPALRELCTDPHYADPDDLSELYEDDNPATVTMVTPNSYVEGAVPPAQVRVNNSDVLPNR